MAHEPPRITIKIKVKPKPRIPSLAPLLMVVVQPIATPYLIWSRGLKTFFGSNIGSHQAATVTAQHSHSTATAQSQP